jgi:hypothetical protein
VRIPWSVKFTKLINVAISRLHGSMIPDGGRKAHGQAEKGRQFPGAVSRFTGGTAL